MLFFCRVSRLRFHPHIVAARREGQHVRCLVVGHVDAEAGVHEQVVVFLLQEIGFRFQLAAQTAPAEFLSTGLLEKLEGQLIEGGYKEDTPAAIVYKATWPEEESYICTVSTLAETAKAHGITKTALIIVGDVVTHHAYERSKLYDPEFTTEFRQGVK